MSDTLIVEPEKDGFKKESPIRAFTDFSVQGNYAIGKGFRPSMAHLVTYLDAMMTKEGWQLVQVIEAAAPTMIFRRPVPYMHVIPPMSEFIKAGLGTPFESRLSMIDGEPLPAQSKRVVFDEFDHMDKPTLATILKAIEEDPAIAKEIGALVISEKLDIGYTNYYVLEYADKQFKTITRNAFSDAPDWVQNILAPEVVVGRIEDEDEGTQPDLGAPHDTMVLVIDKKGHENSAIYQRSHWHDVTRFNGEFPTRTQARKNAPVAWRKEADHGWTTGVDAVHFDVEATSEDVIVARAAERKDEIKALLDNDPINPKHYNGRECADLGAHMTANSFQVLKYNWRLGEKDNPCQEIGKSLWYLEAEIDLFGGFISEWPPQVPGPLFPAWTWVKERTKAAPSDHALQVARYLVSWNRYGRLPTLKLLRNMLQAKLDELNGCADWDMGEGLRP